MRLDDLKIPATPAARAALEVATEYCSPALLNHSVRAYLWAAGYGVARGIAFDAELLYVSAMLHDLGLVKEFDNHRVPFEEAGGHVAWVFGAAAGWPVERRRRAAEVIVRHMWDEVDVAARIPRDTCWSSPRAWTSRGGVPRTSPADLRAGGAARATRGWVSPRSSSRASETRRRASPTAWPRSSSAEGSPPGLPPTRSTADAGPIPSRFKETPSRCRHRPGTDHARGTGLAVVAGPERPAGEGETLPTRGARAPSARHPRGRADRSACPPRSSRARSGDRAWPWWPPSRRWARAAGRCWVRGAWRPRP